MSKLIFSTSGKMGSGKTYFASVTRHFFMDHGKSVDLFAFAEPLKWAAIAMFGLHPRDVETQEGKLKEVLPGITLRYVLQTLGTEWGRNIIADDIWLQLIQKRIEKSAADVIILTDTRFENEAEFVRRIGGRIINIVNPTESNNSTASLHPSEAGFTAKPQDIEFLNFQVGDTLIRKFWREQMEGSDFLK